MKYKKGTFVTVPNKDILKGEKTTTQAIFFWICDYANKQGKCFPSRERLAKDTGLKSVRSVDKYLNRLEKIELITKTARFKKNSKEKDTNLYQINIVDSKEKKRSDANNALGGAEKVKNGSANSAHRTKPISEPKSINNNTLKSSDSGESQNNPTVEIVVSKNSENEEREIDLQEKIAMWKNVTPKYQDFYKNKTERKNLQKLYDNFSEAKIDLVVSLLPKTNALPQRGTPNSFFWKIFSPSKLYRHFEDWEAEFKSKEYQFEQQKNRVEQI